ncbi:MAG: 5-formyltetrahydrofolate cyclo-ligase [Firmicutes bacterium]|jgi:5-formyltetrahydrofolate cyclo-ligase|nr:5-formyltetrahydrofolate cyclo-ligase [Bacillota bacterium]
MSNKDELRRLLKQERRAVPSERRQAYDAAIWDNLAASPVYQDAQNCMTYLSFGWEINTWPFVERMWRDGKKVYVPVAKPDRVLAAVEFRPDTKLIQTSFGIKEPVSSRELDPADLDLIIVPGLAFSPQGYRVGYGGGYYDRFLARTDGVSVGVCYSQFVRPLPVDPWDVPVMYLCTELAFSRKPFPS